MSRRNHRLLFLFIAAATFGLIGFASYYLQGVKHLLPCPMCVAQRIVYAAIGLTALIAAVHGPGLMGRRAYAGLMGLFALTGLGSAARQVWLTYHPQSFDCGISPEEAFLNALPLAKWWPGMFEAEGDCAKVAWKFLGLSIPELSAIAFTGFLLLGVALMLRRR
jgi:protein dithiol:quinone oxidoreductase